jgi:subtilisin family serine protease
MSIIGNGKQDSVCGQPKSKDPLHDAVCTAVAAGVTFVVAAGNHSKDVSSYIPAKYDEVITVSAFADVDGLAGGLDPGSNPCMPDVLDDTFAPFSNFGSAVDISAPGVCVASTFKGNDYNVESGTSFSSPIVAGGAALYLATHPLATPAAVRTALLALAEPGPIAGDPDSFPEGVLDVSTL